MSDENAKSKPKKPTKLSFRAMKVLEIIQQAGGPMTAREISAQLEGARAVAIKAGIVGAVPNEDEIRSSLGNLLTRGYAKSLKPAQVPYEITDAGAERYKEEVARRDGTLVDPKPKPKPAKPAKVKEEEAETEAEEEAEEEEESEINTEERV